jgi:hypothetical protein
MWAEWKQHLSRAPRVLLALVAIDLVWFTLWPFVDEPALWWAHLIVLPIVLVIWAYVIKGVQWLTRMTAILALAWFGFAVGYYSDGKGLAGLGWEHGPQAGFALILGVYLLMFRIRPSRAEWGKFPLVPIRAASAAPTQSSSAPAR